MSETNKTRDLVATLRDALHQLDATLAHTHQGVDEITSHMERLREGVTVLGALQPREVTTVGIDMLIDAATAFLDAFRELESGLLDAQGDIDTLEAALEEDADSQAP